MAVDGVKIVLTVDDSQVSLATQRVGSNMRTIQKSLHDTADSTKKIDHHFNGLAGRFRDLIVVGGLLRFALYDIRDVFGATVGRVVESSAQIEKMTILMKGLSRETDRQAKAMNAIKGRDFVFKMAKNAPFEVNALTDSFVKLKAAGLDPMDGTMQTLVDSVSKFGGSSETLKRASVAIQQMAGKGVISMEELRQQLGEAVPTAMQSMATGTGLSMGQLVKHISNGEVEASNALKRMFTVMKFENEGAAEELNKTWIGQFEKLKTNIALFQNSIGTSGGEEGFFAGIKRDLEGLNAYFETSKAKKFAAEIGEALTSTANMLIGVVKLIVKYSDEIAILGKTLIVMWAGKTIYKGITELSTAVSGYINALKGTISAERAVQTTRLALQREQVMSENKKNNEILANQIATNNGKLAALEMAQNRELASMLAHNKRALAAQLSLERGTTTRGTPVNVDRANATLSSQREFARQAQANAVAFAASQATMAQANAVASSSITTNSTKAGLALATLGTATKGVTIAMGVMKATFNALGGWIGVISIALTAGAALWQMWGDKAKQAADKAADALKAAKNGYAEFADVAQMGNAIRVNEIAAVKIQQDIDKLKLKKSALPSQDSIAGLIIGSDITKLEEELKAAQKVISDNGAMIQAAIVQSNSGISDAYIKGSQRNTDAALAKSEMNVKQKLNEDILAIQGTAKEAEEKTRLTSIAMEKIYNGRAAFYGKLNDNLRAQLKSGLENGVKMDQERIRQKMDLLMSNEQIIQQNLANAKDGKSIAEPMTFMQGDPADANGGKKKLSTIQAFIDDLKAKNAEFSKEVENSNDTLGKLAKFQQQLADGKFNEQVKVGKGKYDTVKPTALQIANANAQILRAGELRDIEANNEFISRQAGEAGKAFDTLESAMLDGQARYDAALDNYNSNGNASDRSSEKMEANLAKQRDAIFQYHTAAGISAEHAAVALEVFDKAANESISNNAIAKMLELTQGWKKKTEELIGAGIENASQRAEYEKTIALKNLDDAYKQEHAKLEGHLEKQQQLYKDYAAYRTALEKDLARKAETPMQKMGRDWRDVTTQMQNASTGWANKTIDAFMELATTGKTSFTGLVESILTDILRIGMQKQMSKMLEGVFGAIEDVVGGAFGGSDESAGGVSLFDQAIGMASRGLNSLISMFTGAKSTTGELTESLAETAVEGVAQAGKSAAASAALNYVASTANAAANALNKLAASAGGASTSGGSESNGLFGDVFDTIGDWFGGGDAAPSESYGGILGMEGVSGGFDFGSLWPFANGGIMSQYGSMELRKYANGGIANSPQMAMFGEGSMNEAYVPLPDGRTIPVTMQGGRGGSNVIVNVINAPAGTETKETKNPDGSTNIDVIIAQVEGKISQNVSKGRGSLSGVMEKIYGLNRATGSYG